MTLNGGMIMLLSLELHVPSAAIKNHTETVTPTWKLFICIKPGFFFGSSNIGHLAASEVRIHFRYVYHSGRPIF